MSNITTGVRFNDIKTLKNLLPFLEIDKGVVESLSANDCVLITQEHDKLTSFTINDPSRAKLTLNYHHAPTDTSGAIVTASSEDATPVNASLTEEVLPTNWQTLIHFPDLNEKISRLFKANTTSTVLSKSSKGGYNFKNSYLNNGRNNVSTLSLKSYSGNINDFTSITSCTYPAFNINTVNTVSVDNVNSVGHTFANILRTINLFSEASKEKRGQSTGSSKQILFCLDSVTKTLQILSANRTASLAYLNVRVPIEIADNVNANVLIALKEFSIESRYIKQLIYLATERVDIYVRLEGLTNWITFKSTNGELTLQILKPTHTYVQNVQLFTTKDEIIFPELTIPYLTLCHKICLLNEIINAVNIHLPIKQDTYINRLVFLEDPDTNSISLIPANDIQAKEHSQIDILFTQENLVPFIILGNILMHCLRVLNYISRNGTPAGVNDLIPGVYFKVKDITTTRVSTINLLITPVFLKKIDDNYNVVNINTNYEIWLSIDKLTTNLDLVDVQT